MLKPLAEGSDVPEIRRVCTRELERNVQGLNWAQRQKRALTLGCPISSSMFIPLCGSSMKEQLLSCVHPDYLVPRGLEASLDGHTVAEDSGQQGRPRDGTMGKAQGLDPVSTCSSNMPSGLRSSKYLKPTQQLLDEFVHVSKAAGKSSDRHTSTGAAAQVGGWRLQLEHSKLSPDANSVSRGRITTLFALLDELDARYEQYRRRIDEVASTFEMVAGAGAANSYTGVAVHAMSRHFSSLRNAIVAQIRACGKPPCGSEDPKGRKGGSVSRPGLPDHKSCSQVRALRSLAKMKVQQVWKPLRGLPEASVAVLRAWLFKHFTHPYPDDNEKLMLASRTGLTRNQISNWFINARVRLWKPMIEEMYREEFANESGDSNPSSSC